MRIFQIIFVSALALFSITASAQELRWLTAAPITLETTHAEITINGVAQDCNLANTCLTAPDENGHRYVVSNIAALVPQNLVFTAQVRLCEENNCGEWRSQEFDCSNQITNDTESCGKIGSIQTLPPAPPTRLRLVISQQFF